jgi:hypothetical protein
MFACLCTYRLLYVHIYLYMYLYLYNSQDSAVGIATGYGLDDRGVGVRVPPGSRIFTSSCHLDRLSGPPSLLSNAYKGKVAGA